MPLKDVDVTKPQPINALFYGPSDAGKTTFLGTFDRLALLVTEKTSSLGALADLWQRRQIKPVRTVIAESREDVEDFLEWLAQPATRQQVATVGFDSITQHGNNLLLQVIDEHQSVFQKKLRVKEVPEQQDWQRMLIPEMRLIKAFSDIGYNTVVTAHARVWIDPLDRRRHRMAMRTGAQAEADKIAEKWYPNLRGQLGDVLPHFFNLVAFCYNDPSVGVRRACFRQTTAYFAKTQYSSVPDTIDNPDYDKLMLAISGQLPQEQTPVIAPAPAVAKEDAWTDF